MSMQSDHNGSEVLIPDSIIGYRLWSIETTVSRLRSMNKIEWPVDNPLLAACHKSISITTAKYHTTPDQSCSCGIYARYSPTDLADLYNEYCRVDSYGHSETMVFGAIKAYGKTNFGPRGFKCEKARVIAISPALGFDRTVNTYEFGKILESEFSERVASIYNAQFFPSMRLLSQKFQPSDLSAILPKMPDPEELNKANQQKYDLYKNLLEKLPLDIEKLKQEMEEAIKDQQYRWHQLWVEQSGVGSDSWSSNPIIFYDYKINTTTSSNSITRNFMGWGF